MIVVVGGGGGGGGGVSSIEQICKTLALFLSYFNEHFEYFFGQKKGYLSCFQMLLSIIVLSVQVVSSRFVYYLVILMMMMMIHLIHR